MKPKVFVCIVAMALVLVAEQAVAHCGPTIARPMLVSSSYSSARQISRYSQSRDAFEAAKTLHNGARLDSSAAAVAFENLSGNISIDDRQRYFEKIFDLAMEVEAGIDPTLEASAYPEPHRSRLLEVVRILRSPRAQSQLIAEWSDPPPRPDLPPRPPPVTPQVAPNLVAQAIRDAALVRDLPENQTGLVAEAAVKTRDRNGSAEIPGLTIDDVKVLASAATKTRLEISELSRDLGEPTESAKSLRSTLGLESSNTFDKSVRDTAVETIAKRLQEAREQLHSLRYEAPANGDYQAWKPVITKFQKDFRLPNPNGLLDGPTRARLQALHVAIEGTTSHPLGLGEWASVTGTEKAPQVIPPGVEPLTQVFEVSTDLANQIALSFNEALGRNAITIRQKPDTPERVLLAVTDTRELNVSEQVAKLIRNDRIGLGLVSNNGSAVFSTKINGKTLLQSTGNGISEIVSVPTSAWDRLVQLLRINKVTPEPKYSISLRATLKKQLRGRDVVVVEGQDLAKIPIEALTSARVVRSVFEERTPEEVVTLVEGAMNKPLRKGELTYFNGAPSSRADFDVLVKEAQLRGNFEDTWLPSVKKVDEALKENGRRGNMRDIAKGLREALSKSDNVIVVVAHSSGSKVFFVENGVLKGIEAAELESAREAISRNRPTVLLLSCNTGPKQSGTVTFGESLLNLGAGLVMAPTRELGVYEVEDFIAALFRGPKNESLVEAVARAIDETGVSGGDPAIKMFVDVVLEEEWPES